MGRTLKIPGSIFESKSSGGATIWKVEIDLGTDVNGKRRRVRRTAHSRIEAEQIREDIWLDKQRSHRSPAAQETVASYAEWWLQNVKRGRIRESTLGDYEYRLAHCILPRFGRMRIGDVAVRDVETWMRDLRTKNELSVKTVNGARTILNQLMTHAATSKAIAINPVALTTPLKSQFGDPTQVKEPWTMDETRLALAAVKNSPLELFLALGVEYGLRRGEILGLHISDFDLQEWTLSIKTASKQARILGADGSVSIKLVEDATKTKASRRILPLSGTIAEAFQRHLQLREVARQKAGLRWEDNELVFASSVGTRVSPSNIRRTLVAALVNSGVRIIRIHDMRHTAAVQALEAGVPLEAVSQALGHTDISTTKRIYAPQVDGFNNQFVTALSERFHPIQKEIDSIMRDPGLSNPVTT